MVSLWFSLNFKVKSQLVEGFVGSQWLNCINEGTKVDISSIFKVNHRKTIGKLVCMFIDFHYLLFFDIEVFLKF